MRQYNAALGSEVLPVITGTPFDFTPLCENAEHDEFAVFAQSAAGGIYMSLIGDLFTEDDELAPELLAEVVEIASSGQSIWASKLLAPSGFALVLIGRELVAHRASKFGFVDILLLTKRDAFDARRRSILAIDKGWR